MRTVLVYIAALTACARPATTTAAPSPTCAPRANADAEVTKTIVDMYAALQTDDIARFKAIVAPGFYAFERGIRMDADTLVKLIADAHAKGRRFEWTVTQPNVRVDCNLAAIAYVNVGAIGDATSMQPISWVESAVLGYDNGAWRIHFFHSTRVPKE